MAIMTLEEYEKLVKSKTAPTKASESKPLMSIDEYNKMFGSQVSQPAKQTFEPAPIKAQTAGESSPAVSYADKLKEEKGWMDTVGAFGQSLVEGLRGAGENTYGTMQFSGIGNMQMADMEKRLQGIDMTNPQAVSDAMKTNYQQAGIESEYAKQIGREIAQRQQAQGQRMADIQRKYEGAPLAEEAIMAGEGIGALIPTMATNLLAPGAGDAIFAANVFGGSLGESLNDGASMTQAAGYALSSAALEKGLEAMFGGIPTMGAGVISPKELTKKYIKTAAGRLLANRLADMTGEGVEEAASEFIQPFLKRAFYDENAENASLADMAQAGKGGALVAAILGIANVPGTVGEYQQNKADIAQENAVKGKATELKMDDKSAKKLTESFGEQTAGAFVQNNIDADFSMENGRYVMHKDGQTVPVTKEMFDYSQRLKAEPYKKTAVQIENNTAGINQVAEENVKPFDVSKLPQAQQGAQPSRMAKYTATLGEGKAKAEYQLNKVRGDTKTTNAQFIEDNLDAGFVQEGNHYFLEKDGRKTSITKAAYDYANYLLEQDEAQAAQTMPQAEIAKDINVPDTNVVNTIPANATEEDIAELAKDENLQATLRQRLIDSGKGSFVKYMDSFEKRTGRKAYLWSGALADTPGFTDLKDVYFNVDHPKLLETTAIHESTHLYKVNNSKKFDTVAKRMLGLVDYNKLDSKFTRTDFSTKMLYEDVYTGKNKDANIEEEVVAKLCEVCIEDPEAFLELVNRDKSIIEVVMDILREIKNSLTVMFSKNERKVEQAKIDNALLALERLLRSDVGEVEAKAETKKSKIPDGRYLELAKNPQANEAELQKMVDEAAKKAGYDSPLLYHGTVNFGFTEIDLSYSDDGISFFATDSLETASTYSTTDKETKIPSYKEIDVEEVLNEIDRKTLDFAESVNRAAGVYNFIDYRECSMAINGFADDLYNDSAWINVKDDFDDYLNSVVDSLYEEQEYYNDDFDIDEFFVSPEIQEIIKIAQEIEELFKEIVEYNQGGAGNYKLYANTEGMLEIDAKDSRWNAIPVPESIDQDGTATTRQLARYAKAEGYTGVKVSNVYDDGGRGFHRQRKPATVYIFLNPQAQVKSADPVTYDNDGNVIPLEERFNTKNPDIRFSKITPEEDDAYMDAYWDGDEDLMLELVEKAAYKAGYRYKAYHHTENGFTVFDLNKARRNMDIQGFYFFAEPDEGDEYGSVRYDTFLKMKKPYIVDSREKQKAIPFDLSKGDAGVTAREWLQSQGYDGVIRKAEYYGAGADEYIVFNSNQIKSAEPATYHDDEYGDGEIIPLSERFNGRKKDIRFSKIVEITDKDMAVARQTIANITPKKLVPGKVQNNVNKKLISYDSAFALDETTGNMIIKPSLISLDESKDNGRLAKGKALLMEQGMSDTEADEAIKKLYDVAEYQRATRPELNYEPDRFYDYIKSNSDYGFSADATTSCIRRKTFQDTYDAVLAKAARMGITKTFDVADYIMLRRMLAQNNYKAGCGVCFVDATRMNLGVMANRFFAKHKDYVDKYGITLWHCMTPEGQVAWQKGDVPQNAGDGFDHQEKFNEFIKIAGSQNRPLPFSNRTDYRNELLAMYLDKSGKVDEKKVAKTNAAGGFRIQSSSDFEATNALDLMQLLFDASAVGIKGQAYSKVGSFFKMVRGTNLMTNISIFTSGKGVDENGKLIPDNVQGVPWKTAKEIRQWQNKDGSYQFGTTLVGATKESIIQAMQEDWIDMVIPFHASGASLRSRKRLGTGEYDDFTKLQTEKIKNAKGKWVSASSNALKSVAEMPAKDIDGNIVIRDGKQVTLKDWYIEGLDKLHNWEWFVEDVSPEQNVKNYLKMCHDYGIKPKFIGTVGSKARGTSKACNFAYETDDINVWYTDDIKVRPGYIKLLEDWRRYESWTPDKDGKYKTVRHKPISTNFDIDAIKEVIEGYKVPTEKYTAEKGQFKGKEFYREKKDIAAEIVDEFLFGKGNTGIVDEKQGFWKRTPTTNDILNYIGNYNEFQSMVNTYGDITENIEKNYGKFKLDVKQLEDNITKASKLMELMEVPEEYRGKSRQEVTSMIREKKAIKPKEKLVPEKFAREQAKKAEDGLPESVGATKANPKNITHMVNEYGEMKPGEKPERFISMPVSTDGNDRVGKFARTAAEAGVTSEKMVQAIEKAVARGDFSHEIWRDKTAIDDAVAYIEKYGYGATLNEFYKRVDNKGQVTKGDMTKAMTMYAVAVENNNIETALKLAVKINKAAVNAGQVVQSVRILKKSSPEGRLFFAQKSLEAYQDEVNEKYGSKAPKLVVDDSILQALKDARTEEEIKKATTELHQVIADQLPFSWSNFITSWRYLAMLGNPRTQVRNVISNTVNSVASEYVNWIQAGIEKSTRMSISTTTDKPTQKQIDYAKLDYQIVKEQLSGEGKYKDNSLNSIERMKNPFSFPTFWGKEGDQFVGWRGNVRKYGEPLMKGLTKWNELTNTAMEKGDLIFSEKAYVKAFARYLKANKINPATITGEEVMDARAWATRQALESVFRENNQLANRISRLERNLVNSNSKGGKVGAVVIGGLMPFKSTPLNITKRAFEYTPLGIIKGIADIKTNEKVYMPAAINDIAKGLSGTSLIILGAALAKYGLLKGGLGDDKEDKMAKQMGQQSYSIDTPWFSYTLDWGGAALMPLFVGADIYESNSEDDSWLMNIVNALANAGSPIIETSMMTGMMDAIQSMSYEDVATEKLVAGLSSAMANYLGQFVPTLFGQVARAVDDTSRSSYTDVKGALKPLAKTAQKAQNKIPFLSKTNVPYMDVWGNAEKNFGGNVVGRLAYNMLSPGYVSTKSNDKVEKMLADLYDKTGETSVLPSNYTTYKRMGDETIRFTDKQYEAYTKAYGQTAYGILEDLSSDKGFKSMEDAYKAEVIAKAYKYSTAIASNDVVDKELTARQANQQKAMAKGLSAYEVFGGLIEADGMGSEGNANGTLSKSEVMAYIESRGGLSKTEKAYLFAALGNSNWTNPYI